MGGEKKEIFIDASFVMLEIFIYKISYAWGKKFL